MKKRKIKWIRLIGVCFLVIVACIGMIQGICLRVDDAPVLKPIVKDRQIACIGDSITYGNGVWQTREQDAWSFLLDEKLPKEYTVHNLGISGATLQKEGNNPYVLSEQWQYAISHPMSLYIVMLGTNDTKAINWNEERYAQQLDTMVKTLLNLSWKPNVVMMLPSRIFVNPDTGVTVNGMQNEILVEKVHPIIKKVAKKYNLQTIDLYAITKNHPEYFADGVHPNLLANRLYAEEIYDHIMKYEYR